MASRKHTYVRIAERVERTGEYELIDPLDFKILELLPDEGDTFAGLYPLGERAVVIVKKLGNKLDSHSISQRLRVMAHQGLTHKTNAPGSAGTAIWQRTATGREVLSKWQSKPTS